MLIVLSVVLYTSMLAAAFFLAEIEETRAWRKINRENHFNWKPSKDV